MYAKCRTCLSWCILVPLQQCPVVMHMVLMVLFRHKKEITCNIATHTGNVEKANVLAPNMTVVRLTTTSTLTTSTQQYTTVQTRLHYQSRLERPMMEAMHPRAASLRFGSCDTPYRWQRIWVKHYIIDTVTSFRNRPTFIHAFLLSWCIPEFFKIIPDLTGPREAMRCCNEVQRWWSESVHEKGRISWEVANLTWVWCL